jgi:hypothetical protein
MTCLLVSSTSRDPHESIRKTIFAACLRGTVKYNAPEISALTSLLRLPGRRMEKQPKNSAMGRRKFLAAACENNRSRKPGPGRFYATP